MHKFVITIVTVMMYGVMVTTTCTSTSTSAKSTISTATTDATATATATATAPASSTTTRSLPHHRRQLFLSPEMECVLYLKDIQFMDGSGEESWSCEFDRVHLSLLDMFDDVDVESDNNDRDHHHGRRHSHRRYYDTIMDVEGISSALLEAKGAVSGQSIMKMMKTKNNNNGTTMAIMPTEKEDEEEQEEPTAVVPMEVPYIIVLQQHDDSDDDNEDNNEIMKLFIPNNGDTMMIEQLPVNDTRRRKLATSNPGTILKTLVVRVSDQNGTRMMANTSQLVNDIFDDAVSLRTQYRACSKGQLRIEPASEVTDSNGTGIVDIVIPLTAAGKSRSVLQNAAVGRANALYGGSEGLRSRFDLVLFCFPQGSGNWIAYAYINRWASFYNNIGNSEEHWWYVCFCCPLYKR